MKQIQTSEGYCQNGVYYYYLKDHLGNTRVVINSSGTTVEKSHYYPFGMRFYPESTSNSAAIGFRYNGKEFETMNGLNRYDYGARFYDPALGRWHVIDNKAEKYYRTSPYTYALNNPIRFIDPDGNVVVDATNKPITYSAKSGWSSNVTADVRRVGTSMMATPKGTEMFNKMMSANHNITITIDPGKGDGSDMGDTNSSKSGNSIGKANIIIYEGKAQEKLDNLNLVKEGKATFNSDPTEKTITLLNYTPKTVDEMMAATAAHEAEHATNKAANANFETNKSIREGIANQTQIEVIKQTSEYRLERLDPKTAIVK